MFHHGFARVKQNELLSREKIRCLWALVNTDWSILDGSVGNGCSDPYEKLHILCAKFLDPHLRWKGEEDGKWG
jgi:hypothetical protein